MTKDVILVLFSNSKSCVSITRPRWTTSCTNRNSKVIKLYDTFCQLFPLSVRLFVASQATAMNARRQYRHPLHYLFWYKQKLEQNVFPKKTCRSL